MGLWIFLRHGESEANAAGRLAGWDDVALTALGRSQAREAGQQLREDQLQRVLVSDLARARDTARLALEGRKVDPWPPVIITEALRERNCGEMQGRSLEEERAAGRTALLLGWDSRPPGGESQADMAARALPFLAGLPDDGNTLLVGHGGLNRVLVGLLDGLHLEEIGRQRIANAELLRREVPQGRWSSLAARFGRLR
jgi:broad specificity phosphatase PhoE